MYKIIYSQQFTVQLALYKAFKFLRKTIEKCKTILNFSYKNVYFAMLNGWNVTKTSFDHAWAGMEESCLWALGRDWEEGRVASKSPHYTFGYFLSMSHQAVSADIIQNSAVGNFSPKTEETKTKAATGLFSLMSFPFLYILNNLHLLLLLTFCQVCLLKWLQRLKQERQKSSPKVQQKLGLAWRNRKKISQIIKDYFTYRSSY